MLGSKLKEALICLKNLRVTLPYPNDPVAPADGFRGRIELDARKCIGCGACALACPPRLISLNDIGNTRAVAFTLGSCTYCGRCAEVCPEKAIIMTKEFELSTADKRDLNISLTLPLVTCDGCGQTFTTKPMFDKVTRQLPEKTGLAPEAITWLNTCPTCRVQHEVRKLVEARV